MYIYIYIYIYIYMIYMIYTLLVLARGVYFHRGAYIFMKLFLTVYSLLNVLSSIWSFYSACILFSTVDRIKKHPPVLVTTPGKYVSLHPPLEVFPTTKTLRPY